MTKKNLAVIIWKKGSTVRPGALSTVGDRDGLVNNSRLIGVNGDDATLPICYRSVTQCTLCNKHYDWLHMERFG